MLHYLLIEESDLESTPDLASYDGSIMENGENFGVLLAWKGHRLLVVGTRRQLADWAGHFGLAGSYAPVPYEHGDE